MWKFNCVFKTVKEYVDKYHLANVLFDSDIEEEDYFGEEFFKSMTPDGIRFALWEIIMENWNNVLTAALGVDRCLDKKPVLVETIPDGGGPREKMIFADLFEVLRYYESRSLPEKKEDREPIIVGINYEHKVVIINVKTDKAVKVSLEDKHYRGKKLGQLFLEGFRPDTTTTIE